MCPLVEDILPDLLYHGSTNLLLLYRVHSEGFNSGSNHSEKGEQYIHKQLSVSLLISNAISLKLLREGFRHTWKELSVPFYRVSHSLAIVSMFSSNAGELCR